MKPTIHTFGAVNSHINYTLDQLLQAEAEKPSGIPSEVYRDMKARSTFKVDKGPQDKPKKLSNYYSNSWITGVYITEEEDFVEDE